MHYNKCQMKLHTVHAMVQESKKLIHTGKAGEGFSGDRT